MHCTVIGCPAPPSCASCSDDDVLVRLYLANFAEPRTETTCQCFEKLKLEYMCNFSTPGCHRAASRDMCARRRAMPCISSSGLECISSQSDGSLGQLPCHRAEQHNVMDHRVATMEEQIEAIPRLWTQCIHVPCPPMFEERVRVLEEHFMASYHAKSTGSVCRQSMSTCEGWSLSNSATKVTV